MLWLCFRFWEIVWVEFKFALSIFLLIYYVYSLFIMTAWFFYSRMLNTKKPLIFNKFLCTFCLCLLFFQHFHLFKVFALALFYIWICIWLWKLKESLTDGTHVNQLPGANSTIIFGAASKGIIKRDQQNNAVVYKTYYAATNPFQQMDPNDLEKYKKEIAQKQIKEQGMEEYFGQKNLTFFWPW